MDERRSEANNLICAQDLGLALSYLGNLLYSPAIIHRVPIAFRLSLLLLLLRTAMLALPYKSLHWSPCALVNYDGLVRGRVCMLHVCLVQLREVTLIGYKAFFGMDRPTQDIFQLGFSASRALVVYPVGWSVLATTPNAETDEASFPNCCLLKNKPLPRPLFQAVHPSPTIFSTASTLTSAAAVSGCPG